MSDILALLDSETGRFEIKICFYTLANIDLGEHLTSAGFRKGQASDNHTCDHVREVPEYLRSDEEMYKGIAPFYQKYTEAYGIPVLGRYKLYVFGLLLTTLILDLHMTKLSFYYLFVTFINRLYQCDRRGFEKSLLCGSFYACFSL